MVCVFGGRGSVDVKFLNLIVIVLVFCVGEVEVFVIFLVDVLEVVFWVCEYFI